MIDPAKYGTASEVAEAVGEPRTTLINAANRGEIDKAETLGWMMSEKVSTESVKELAANMTVHQPNEALSADLAVVGNKMATEWAASVGDAGKIILDALK